MPARRRPDPHWSRDRATSEIEAEAELGEQRQLETDVALQPLGILIQLLEKRGQRGVERRVRIALGQRRLEQGAGRGEPGEASRIGHQARRERHLSSPVSAPSCSDRRARQVT